MTEVTRPGNIQNPRLRLTWPTAQVILGWLASTHNNCVVARKLNVHRVQAANDFWNPWVVWLEVNLVCQRGVQHGKKSIGDLPSLRRCAAITRWPKNENGAEGYEQKNNPTGNQDKLAGTFHGGESSGLT
jgi:hypothetical protein